MNALEQTSQTGACDILRNVSYPVQKDEVIQLMNIFVEVFGRITTLQTAFPCITSENLREILKCEEARTELRALINTKGASLLLDGAVPKAHSFYIPRSICNRILLDPELFRKDCTDVFVFNGIERNNLVVLVDPHVTRSSSTQRSKVTCRHIYLDDEKDWDDILLHCKAPTHLVLKMDQDYVLQRTTRVTEIIRSHSKN